MQSKLAEEKGNSISLQLLEIWARQIIEAHIMKAENNIPDAPNEITLAIAGIEHYQKCGAERNEVVNEEIKVRTGRRTSAKHFPDPESQLELFYSKEIQLTSRISVRTSIVKMKDYSSSASKNSLMRARKLAGPRLSRCFSLMVDFFPFTFSSVATSAVTVLSARLYCTLSRP